MIISSFSGGRTSAYMTKVLKDQFGSYLKVVFMNTGLEHEETLKFVHACDEAFGLNIEWIEASVNHDGRIGTSYKTVNYYTAKRDNSIAKEVVSKYGLFGMGYLHCTREMKLQPFRAWKKTNGLDHCLTAIGIRADEADRMNEKYKEENLFYPLIGMGVTKATVSDFWATQLFDLDLPEWHGNCKVCWKKSDRKLMRNAKDHPEWFYEIMELEQIDTNGKGADKMFRHNRSAQDVLSEAHNDLDLFDDTSDSGCQSSCEVFGE